MIISDTFSEVINIFPLRKLKIETNESIVDIQWESMELYI